MNQKQRDGFLAEQKRKKALRRVRIDLTESHLDVIVALLKECNYDVSAILESIERQRISPPEHAVRLSSFKREIEAALKFAEREHFKFSQLFNNKPDTMTRELKLYFEGQLSLLRNLHASVVSRLLKVK